MRKIFLLVLVVCLVGASGCSTWYGKMEDHSQRLIGKNYMLALTMTDPFYAQFSTFQCNNGNATICVPYMSSIVIGQSNMHKRKSGAKYICYEADSSSYIRSMYDAQYSPVGTKVDLDNPDSLSCGNFTSNTVVDGQTGKIVKK